MTDECSYATSGFSRIRARNGQARTLDKSHYPAYTMTDEAVKIEVDTHWEGPGDAFQLIVASMAGLEVQVTPADGSPAFHALLVGGYVDYEDGDVDNATVIQVRRFDSNWEPMGEPENVRIKALRISS
jgi:hypothetical protein